MFTGIIEEISKVIKISKKGREFELIINNPFDGELSTGDSISVDGTCLTVEKFSKDFISFFISRSTAEKTIVSKYRSGSIVNLERAMKVDGRFDGHIVQGHVDTSGVVLAVNKIDLGMDVTFRFNRQYSNNIVPRGSVSVNGVSLTVSSVSDDSFSVSVIPETLKRTAFSENLKAGMEVNLEFDIIGKYVAKLTGESHSGKSFEAMLENLK